MAFIYRPKGRKKLYVRFRNAAGRLETVAGYVDRGATLQLAARLEREVAMEREGMPVPSRIAKTMADQLPAYLNHLRAKGDSEQYIATCAKRIQQVLTGTNNKLTAESVKQWLAEQRSRPRKPVSITTSNHYLTACKCFLWWLADERGLPSNPLRKLKRLKSEAGAKVRRGLTADELGRLFAAAELSPAIVGGLSGVSRSMLYLVAAYTGLRSSELSSLVPSSFHGGSVTVAAAYSKRRRRDTVPMPEAVRVRFAAWLKGLPKGETIWPRLRKRAYWAETIRRDLETAGIAVETPAGIVDFHSLRVTYVTMLARAGVPIQVAQRLARHSTPELTSNIYTRLGADDLKEAAGKLTLPMGPTP